MDTGNIAASLFSKAVFKFPLTKSNIGLLDADLLDSGTRHPNLALMKIAGYCKERNHDVRLIINHDQFNQFDIVYVSKVFSGTKLPLEILQSNKAIIGGTGFFFDKAPDLPQEVEHHMPDYHLYDEYIESELKRGIKPIRFRDYRDYSIGFATRGCFRKCDFCVNRKYDCVRRHTSIGEFFDSSRKYIYLWDDNLLGFPKWREVFEEIAATGRRYQCRQGLDIRLMTKEKAMVLVGSKYIGDYIFAFDSLNDKDITKRKLKIWRKYCDKTTKLYILCAYESTKADDISSIFERISILMAFRCLPYIMRYEGWEKSQYRGMYINIARWANQPDFFKKKSFRQYCEANGAGSATMRYFSEFESENPEIAAKYFDMRYDQTPLAF